MRIPRGTWELSLGDIDFSPSVQTEEAWFVVYGLQRGKAVPVTKAVDTLLRDGADERIDRYDPRDMSIVVGINGTDSGARNALEAALAVECQKAPNVLRWKQPDGFGATTVFEVLWADLDPNQDDDWDRRELLESEFVYTVTVRAQPFGKSDFEVVDVAIDAGAVPVSTTIADGSSASGWTCPDGTVTASGGVLHVPTHYTSTTTYFWAAYDQFEFEATKTLTAFDFSAEPFLQVEVAAGSPSAGAAITPFGISAEVDGVPVTVVATETIAAKTVRVTVYCTDSSASTLKIFGALQTIQSFPLGGSPLPHPTVEVRLDNVAASNIPPNSSSTGRETLKKVTIRGSARTQGRVMIEHETEALGDVILYSRPGLNSSNTPNQRKNRTSGPTSPASVAGTISGKTETLGVSDATATVFQVPAASLCSGAHLAYARVRAASGSLTRTLTLTASTLVGATPMEVESVVSDTEVLTDVWTWVELGELSLPPADVTDNSAANVELRLWASDTNVVFDELLTFYAGEDSALTFVRAGNASSPALGTAHNRLRLDTPTLEDPKYTAYLGTQADWSDAFYAGRLVDALGIHQLPAGDSMWFLVNSGDATYPKLSVAHTPNWMLHALNLDDVTESA